MVKEGCPSRTSLGITRSFPRLYPTMGLVTFALLTLTPLALRPVRLACLIHAANVHSEPGSNPSKVPLQTPPLARERKPSTFPQERLRNANWSHRAVRFFGRSLPVSRNRTRPQRPKTKAVLKAATAGRRLPSRVHIQARSTIDRIVKEHSPADACGRCDRSPNGADHSGRARRDMRRFHWRQELY